MQPGGDDRRPADYRQARLSAALGLTAALVGLLFIDALSPTYEVSPVVVGILGTMILGLLGIEGVSTLMRRP